MEEDDRGSCNDRLRFGLESKGCRRHIYATLTVVGANEILRKRGGGGTQIV